MPWAGLPQVQLGRGAVLSLRVREDEDNCAVIQSARDALKLIQNKFLPAVCSWVQLFTRAGTHGGHLEAAIGLKAELETALRKSRELNIEPEGPRRREAASPGSESEDDDFVEVPEWGGHDACGPDLQPKDDHGKFLRVPEGSQVSDRHRFI